MKASSVRSTIAKVMLADGFNFVLDLKKSKGCYIHDALRKRDILDMYSFIASLPVGHNHPELLKRADELKWPSIANPTNADCYTEEMALFVDTFRRIAMPKEFKHLFLVAGGSVAVENAIKTAMDWKVRHNIQKKKMKPAQAEKGTMVMHLTNAFHGRTGYSLSLTNVPDKRKTTYFQTFDWPRVPGPAALFPLTGKNLEVTETAEKKAIFLMKAALKKHRNNICAFIMEPIQGEGGDNHFRPEFFQALRELADENDFLFMLDEVQTGFGLTGKFWAYQHFGIVPDVIAFGKKAQVCGIIAGKRIDEVQDNVFQIPSRINSTWGGNLVDMARCRIYLDIINRHNLVRNAAEMGPKLLSAIQRVLAGDKRFSNIRGRGLMCAFDTPSADARLALRAKLLEENVLAVGCGATTMRLRPSLIMGEKEILRFESALGKAVVKLK